MLKSTFSSLISGLKALILSLALFIAMPTSVLPPPPAGGGRLWDNN